MKTMYSFTLSIVLFLTLFASAQLLSICPSGITAIAYFDANVKQLPLLKKNVASAVKSGLDYIAIDMTVTESDNAEILSQQLLGQIEPVDSQGVSNQKFPENFAPQLQQLLALPLDQMGIVVIINKNSLPSDLFVKTLAELVNQYNRTKKGNPVLVGTFSPQTSLYLKKYFPELPFVAFAQTEGQLFTQRKYEPKIYALTSDLANQQLITQLNNESKGVWIFTVDDPKEMEKLAKEGADGLITKEASELLKLKEKLSKECQNVIN